VDNSCIFCALGDGVGDGGDEVVRAVSDVKFNVKGGGDGLEVVWDIVRGDNLFLDKKLVIEEVKDEEAGVIWDRVVMVVELLEVPYEDSVGVVPFGEVLCDKGGSVCHSFGDKPLVFVDIAEEGKVVTLEVINKFFSFKAVSDAGFDETDATVVEGDFVVDVGWRLEGVGVYPLVIEE